MRFAIFPFHVRKVLRLPRKSDARSYEVLHLSRKIILANLKIWCSKMQPISGNQRPDLLTSLMNMSLLARLPREMNLSRSSLDAPCLPSFLDMRQNPQVGKVQNPLRLPHKTTSAPPKVVEHVVLLTLWLGNLLRATTAYTFSTAQFLKALPCWGVLCILTSKCASRHNGVHFFDISTSKSAPRSSVFNTFDFEMCFAQQQRAIFHLSSGQMAPHPPL